MLPPFRYLPNMGLQGGYMPNPTANSYDGRTPYTGSFQTGVDARSEAGNVNNVSGGGPKIGPEGVVPLGGMSQLYGRPNNTNTGWTAPPPGPRFDPYATDPSGAPLSGYYQPPATPKPGEMPGAPAGNPSGRPTPKPGEIGRTSWGGGFGMSDNSAWGNALGPTMQRQEGKGPLTTSAFQPQGHMNSALPPGYGSVFGLGGR